MTIYKEEPRAKDIPNGSDGAEMLAGLIRDSDHLSILHSELSSADDKVVALIKLERHEEALRAAKNNSYEKAYCYYRVKKYKSCLKTVGGRLGEKWAILKAQALYALGRYRESAQAMQQVLQGDERAVNFSAAVSLGRLSDLPKSPSVFASTEDRAPHRNDIHRPSEARQIKDLLLREEFAYNQWFESLHDPGIYARTLKAKECECKCEEVKTLVKNQLLNLTENFSEIDTGALSKRNAKVVEYNASHGSKSSIDYLDHFLHFQRQIYLRNELLSLEASTPSQGLGGAVGSFLADQASPELIAYVSLMNDHNVFHLVCSLLRRKACSRKVAALIPCKSSFLVALKSYLCIKAGRQGTALKCLDKVDDGAVKEHLLALAQGPSPAH